MNGHVLILGAQSAIAQAFAHRLAPQVSSLTLAGRDAEELERIAADLRIRHGARVYVQHFDALEFGQHQPLVDQCVERAGGLDGVVLCHGWLCDQQQAQEDFATARRAIDVNFTSCVSLLNAVAAYLANQGRGTIVAISSVAGDRGRQSNYVYGSAKAALSVFLQGLRNRLAAHGVHVLTVKPGFVDTPMTHGLINPDSPLVASPQQVAVAIERAVRHRRNTVYAPAFWWWIMTAIRCIPEPLFKRMKL